MAKVSALERAIAQMDDEITALETAREFLIRMRPKPAVVKKPLPKPDASKVAHDPTH
jgi:hypothetical protein